MNKILISACLLGDRVRYDGKSKHLKNGLLESLIKNDQVIGYCPEVAGGLSVPRPAAEILGGDGERVLNGSARLRTHSGEDVTEAFILGAQRALALCQRHRIKIAVLTEFSPSCGSQEIYDGSFSRRKSPGAGVTTAMLRQHGIRVFNQFQLEQAIRQLASDNSTKTPQS